MVIMVEGVTFSFLLTSYPLIHHSNVREATPEFLTRVLGTPLPHPVSRVDLSHRPTLLAPSSLSAQHSGWKVD